MRLFEVKLKLESPMILTSRRTERGFLSPLNVIPGMTIRGAMISMFHHLGLLDENQLKNEAESPTLIASPGYPVINGRRSYPCHVFAYKCKIPHEEGPKTGVERKIYIAEVFEELKSGSEPKFKMTCSQGHAALETIHPKPVIPEGDAFIEVGLTHEHIVCVGMSRHRATAQRQLLYEYEAIAAGQEFWFRIGLPEELADELRHATMLYIGRGISRGFGRARIAETLETDLDDLSETIHQACENNSCIILYALSNLASIRNSRYSPYPREIDLGNIAAKFELNASGKLLIQKAYGKHMATPLGWDMIRNVRRPTLEYALSPGSILVSKLVGGKNWEIGLAALSYIGSIEMLQLHSGDVMPITGVNILEPIMMNPMKGE